MSRRRAQAAAHRATATFVRRRPSWDFSLTGLLYVAMMMFMGLAAVNTQANLLFAVFGLMLGVLLISGMISRFMLRRLRVRRVLPEHMVVGERAVLSYEFTNEKRYSPSLSVSLNELDGCEAFTKQPYAYMLHAPPGLTATVAVDLIPKRRGIPALERYQLSTSFPFGFIRRAWTAKLRESVVVYPALAQVNMQRLLRRCRSAERTGTTMRPRRGGADEFYGVKEYRSGENPRWIYWRRSAHSGVLVVKEMTQVSPPRLLLLVDTYVAQRTPEAQAAVERTIAMAASVANSALESGLPVGLCVWSSDGWLGMAPERGKRHRRDLLTALARLPLNEQQPAASLLEESRRWLRAGTTPLLFSPTEASSVAGGGLGGAMVTIGADGVQAREWFHFRPEVEFAQSMPVEQQLSQAPQRGAGLVRRMIRRVQSGSSSSSMARPWKQRHAT